MAIFSSLFKAIFAVIKRIIKAVVEFIKKYWWVLLIVLAIYFAPVVLAYLTTAGAPAFLTSTFSWVAANLTPLLTSAMGWLTSVGGTLFSAAGQAWSGLSLGTKLAVVSGAMALIAPEETEKFLTDLVETGTDIVSTVAGALFGAIPTVVWVAAAGLLAWWLLGSGDEDDDDERAPNSVQRNTTVG